MKVCYIKINLNNIYPEAEHDNKLSMVYYYRYGQNFRLPPVSKLIVKNYDRVYLCSNCMKRFLGVNV